MPLSDSLESPPFRARICLVRRPANMSTLTVTIAATGRRATPSSPACAPARDGRLRSLEGFVRADRMGELVAECDRVINPRASQFRHQSLFHKDRPDLPTSHPLRRFYDRSGARSTRQFRPEHAACDLEMTGFAPFIRRRSARQFYRYRPAGGRYRQPGRSRQRFPWHFDANNYTVTWRSRMQIWRRLQYSPRLRTPADENYSGVKPC
jgi:hypothetical protein